MANPKVTIIVPVYNGESFIRRGLDTLAGQTLKDIEIICANDCSTDKSLDILQDYAQKDKRFKIINMPQNGGQGIAKNTAIDKALGEYIMFMDQDDWFEPDACELAYNQAHRNGNDLVLFDFSHYWEELQTATRDRKLVDAFKDYLGQPQIKLHRLQCNWLRSGWAWCYIYKKSLLDKYKIRFMPQFRNVDDVPFIGKALVYADSFSVIDKSLYIHRENLSSVTYTRNDLWYENFAVGDMVLRIVEQTNHARDFMPVFLDYFTRRYLYWYKFYSRDENWKKKSSVAYYKKMKTFFTAIEKKYEVGSLSDFAGNNLQKYYDIQELSDAELDILGAKGAYTTISLLGVEIYKKIKTTDGKIMLYLFNIPFFSCCPQSNGTKMYYLFGVPVIGTSV